MSNRYLKIGSAPTEENCAQADQPDYFTRHYHENLVFERMLDRLFPVPDDVNAHITVVFSVPGEPYFRYVSVHYDNCDPRAVEYASHVKRNVPANWDDIAHYELMFLACKGRWYDALRRGELKNETVIPLQFQHAQNVIQAVPSGKTLLQLLVLYPLPDQPPGQQQG